MRVFLAGGSGAVGKRLVPLLAHHGHEVTATTRTPAKAGLIVELGATAVVVDALDAAALRAALHFAGTAAAITCSRRGADLPSLEEVQAQE
jgi:2-alkyl-3-oxoalkanoate reductase